jgi:hypothetical protein
MTKTALSCIVNSEFKSADPTAIIQSRRCVNPYQRRRVGYRLYGLACVAALLFIVFTCAVAQMTGEPYGHIDAQAIADVAALAESKGVDLHTEIRKAYSGDQEALARLFQLSSSFRNLNGSARAYGQIIYSTFLNIGESFGTTKYVAILSHQSTTVQQRVRDFLYYPIFRLPPTQRADVDAETRGAYPMLFPLEFEFGRNDPVFK